MPNENSRDTPFYDVDSSNPLGKTLALFAMCAGLVGYGFLKLVAYITKTLVQSYQICLQSVGLIYIWIELTTKYGWAKWPTLFMLFLLLFVLNVLKAAYDADDADKNHS